MSSFPGMRKLRITANDTKSLATKYSQAHFIYGNTEWFTAYKSSDGNALPPLPAGVYLLEAERKGDKAHFLLSCDRQGTTNPLVFQKDLPAEAMLDLQKIIRKYNLPAINGSNLRNSALGTSLRFLVLYDTDEKITVYAEGGASTLPHGWCGTSVFLEFFLDKIDTEGLL